MKKPLRKKKPPLKGKKGDKRPSRPPADRFSSRAPDRTLEEVKYLKQLVERKTPVMVKLRNNEEIAGTVEYYDSNFIRLTRPDGPNLFIFKHDVKYLYERSPAAS